MTIMPHEHRMWAVIGVYTGGEDNMFWRRIGEPGSSKVEAAGAAPYGSAMPSRWAATSSIR